MACVTDLSATADSFFFIVNINDRLIFKTSQQQFAMFVCSTGSEFRNTFRIDFHCWIFFKCWIFTSPSYILYQNCNNELQL